MHNDGGSVKNAKTCSVIFGELVAHLFLCDFDRAEQRMEKTTAQRTTGRGGQVDCAEQLGNFKPLAFFVLSVLRVYFREQVSAPADFLEHFGFTPGILR